MRGKQVRKLFREDLRSDYGSQRVAEYPPDDSERRWHGHGVYSPIAFFAFSTVAIAIGVIRSAPSASTRAR